MGPPVLSIRDLTVSLSRDGVPAQVLDRVEFDIAPGEILALVGESGSGKSTIGLALQGLLPVDSKPRCSGSIQIAGTELVGATEGVLRGVRRSLVRSIPQDPLGSLDPTMTIRRQMREPGRSDAEIASWLARVGLPATHRIGNSYPHRLSGGERQRVLIAMAMMAHPSLLIADEPTTALDVTTQAPILDLLRDIAREQRTAVLFITHDLAVASSTANRIVVLDRGRVVEAGEVSAIMRSPAHPRTAGMLASRFHLGSDRSLPLPVVGRIPMGPWPPLRIEATDALRMIGVSKSLGGRPGHAALTPIDLSVRVGECVALVGESGAGKSTLLRIAAGLISADSGVVYTADAHPRLVFQDAVTSLTPWLTIGEQIAEPLRSLAVPERNARVAEVLALVGLDGVRLRARPADLSLGQCQRAALARAIAVPPKLLLCDEPVSAMDVSLAASILNLLGDLRRRLGMAVLFVTHDIAAARIVADRIGVLHKGRLIEIGESESLVASPLAPQTRALIAAVPRLGAMQ